MQVLEIISMTDLVVYERFIDEWIQVLELLLPLLDIQFVNLTAIPHLKQLTGYKVDAQSRTIGFKILTKVLLAHGLTAFESDLCYKRLVQ